MRLLAALGIIGAVTIGMIVLFINKSSAPEAPAAQLVASTVIYDVRTPEEYAESHVPAAKLFPLQDLQAGKLPDTPKDTPIAVYCRSGNRSSEALQLLKQAGYTHVTDLGGLNDLPKYGLKATRP
jgi:rhodanese-related sulfurtransferase